MSDIDSLFHSAREQIARATSSTELEQARVQHLGRSAPLVLLLREIPKLPPDQRAVVGREGNKARAQLEKLVQHRADELAAEELDAKLAAERIDVTLPPVELARGTLHLLTQTRREIEDVFIAMGYDVVVGPEVESEYYNFTALNTPEGHPARAESDTFFVAGDAPDAANGRALLRTQTSPVQVRAMQLRKPPLYVISPGRTYRRDEIDATHSHEFHQVEGLAVDEGLTLADLKGTIQTACRAIFGEARDIRLRPHFFPFTEPSVEADVSCFRCDGTGHPQAGDEEYGWCRLCKGAGWIEIMGAGMVDPNVFALVDGYDTARWSGFAFGIGVERVAMLRHGVPDMRLLFENDLRFVRQFGGVA